MNKDVEHARGDSLNVTPRKSIEKNMSNPLSGWDTPNHPIVQT